METTDYGDRNRVCRLRIVYFAAAFLFFLAGMAIYAFFRNLNIMLFEFFPKPSFLSMLHFPVRADNIFLSMFIFNLPDGLWFLSGLLIIRVIWLANPKWTAVYIGIFSFIALSLEISQLFEGVSGTFDPLDILFMAFFAILESVIYNKFSKSKISLPEQLKQGNPLKHFFVRLSSMMLGLLFYAIGIVITIKANVGYAPWDVFHVGLAHKTGLSIGLVSIIVGLAIVILVTSLKEKFGLGTILNMIFIGFFLDLIFPYVPIAKNMVIGFVMLIAGLFIISIGSYFYIKSGFGVGPRDNLMVVLARKTKLPAGLCRFAVELVATGIGWFLGGMVWIGTVVSAIAIGFCIQITFRFFKFDVTAVKHETVMETIAWLVAYCKGAGKMGSEQEQ